MRAGRIPEAALVPLREHAQWPRDELGILVFCLFFGFLALMLVDACGHWLDGSRWGDGLSMLGRWSWYALLGGLGVSAMRTVARWFPFWIQAHRDLRRRGLVVEEGVLTRKQRTWWGDEEVVHIGNRRLRIRSYTLLPLLGSGVRYRMHLSAHAKHLVAIESVEPEMTRAGYRGAPLGSTARRGAY